MDPQASDFFLEIAGHVVGAMIVTQLQSTRHPGRDGSEALVQPLYVLDQACLNGLVSPARRSMLRSQSPISRPRARFENSFSGASYRRGAQVSTAMHAS